MTETNRAVEADTIASLGRETGSKIVEAVGEDKIDRRFLVTHKDMVVKDVTDPHGQVRERPHHVVDIAKLDTPQALIDYLDRFKTLDTLAFADVDKGTIVAVMDYHSATVSAAVDVAMTDMPVAANFAQHRAFLTLMFSEEWKAWTGIDDKMMSQLEFARFIEEHADDITDPAAADLLEVCRALQATRKASFNNVVRTETGEQNFAFTTEADARAVTRTGEVPIPHLFYLRIPVFEGHDTVDLSAFLRWNIDGNALALGIHLRRKTIVRQQAFARIVTEVGTATLCPIVQGQAPARG